MNTIRTDASAPKSVTGKRNYKEGPLTEPSVFQTELKRLSLENSRLKRASASVAHDLKNHLQIMLMTMEGTGKIQAEPAYRNIYDHTLAMKETVSDIMEQCVDYRSGETCSVMNVIFEVINLLGDCAKFIVMTGMDEPLVRMPSAAFKQIVFNIAYNSIRHSKKEEPIIMIDISGNRKNLKFHFQDNGAGIPPEIAACFEQVEPSENPGLESGSGLWFIRESVLEHHGTVRIREGAFIITLPAP
jgi:K+-sensing histidine kinase KdpD